MVLGLCLLVTTAVSAASTAAEDPRTGERTYTLLAVDSDGHEIVREMDESELDALDEQGACTFDPETNACSSGQYGPGDSLMLGWIFPQPSGVVHGDFQNIAAGESGATAAWTCSVTGVLGRLLPQMPMFDCHLEPGYDFPLGEVYTHQCYAYPHGQAEPGGDGADGWLDLPSGSIQCVTTG